ncbi:MAG: Phosphoglycerate mutase [Oscillospiraceae bacterium]|nr:Phosphoglycerate mutase [Oscillospiraceae bacterium]
MTRIYLIRHAEAEGNLYRRVHGWYDSLITENGHLQIKALEERFADVPLDAVYSSDLFRAKTTANALCAAKGLKLRIRSDLREVNMGEWEDNTWAGVNQVHPELLTLFNHNSSRWQVEGGETLTQLRDRVSNAILEIAADHDGETVAVVSHGMAIRNVLAKFLGQPVDETEILHGDNTCVALLEIEGERVGIAFHNDNSHLGELSTFKRQSFWKKGGGALSDASLWFRPLDFQDYGKLYYEARKEAWSSIHGSLKGFDGEGFYHDAVAQTDRDARAVMLAMLGDQPAGMIQLDFWRDVDQKVGGIPFYYMMPETREKGIGVQLLGEAISLYRKMGREKLRLRCAPDNDRAQRFYKRYGFVKIAEEQGSRIPLDVLEKKIGY